MDEVPAIPNHQRWFRARIIANPNAGTKGGVLLNRTTIDAACAALAQQGLSPDLVLTESASTAAEAAREAAATGYDLVIAAGGDGTVGRVATALIGSATVLGILPLGSVMNIARSLNIPRDLEGAAAVIAHGVLREIDVGQVRDRIFFEAGSVGLNAAIFREVNRIDDGDWRGIARSIWIALRYSPARMTIALDDRTLRTRALLTTVSNGPYIGLGFTVAPAARLDDGLFDVRIFRGFSRLELFRYFIAIAFGRRRYSPKIETYRSARVHISTAHPLAARVDAQDLGTTPVLFTVHHRAVRVVVPGPR